MDTDVFDPDAIAERIDRMTAAEFGRLIAAVIDEQRSSNAYGLVSQACEKVTGWSPDHEQTEALCQRLAAEQEPGMEIDHILEHIHGVMNAEQIAQVEANGHGPKFPRDVYRYAADQYLYVVENDDEAAFEGALYPAGGLVTDEPVRKQVEPARVIGPEEADTIRNDGSQPEDSRAVHDYLVEFETRTYGDAEIHDDPDDLEARPDHEFVAQHVQVSHWLGEALRDAGELVDQSSYERYALWGRKRDDFSLSADPALQRVADGQRNDPVPGM